MAGDGALKRRRPALPAVVEAIDVLRADDPRRAWTNLPAGKLAPFHHALEGRITDAKLFGGFLNGELPARLPFAWGVVRDRVVISETSDTASCPAVSFRRFDPHAVQLGRNLLVGHHSGQLLNERQRTLGGLPAVLAGFRLRRLNSVC